MDILSNIQARLNAPKSQYNKFGKYYFRNCEDILEGLKPLLKEHECSVVVEDDIVMVGNRIYVKATVKLLKDKDILGRSTGFAREAEKQSGMQEGQLTGSTSSYARKYALNGLFAIDDNKDADTNEHQENVNNRPKQDNYVNNVQKKFNGQQLEPRKEIFNMLESGKIPEADKEAYIRKFKANPETVNAASVSEIKAKYFG